MHSLSGSCLGKLWHNRSALPGWQHLEIQFGGWIAPRLLLGVQALDGQWAVCASASLTFLRSAEAVMEARGGSVWSWVQRSLHCCCITILLQLGRRLRLRSHLEVNVTFLWRCGGRGWIWSVVMREAWSVMSLSLVSTNLSCVEQRNDDASQYGYKITWTLSSTSFATRYPEAFSPAKGIIGTGTHSRAGLWDVTCKWLWQCHSMTCKRVNTNG